MGSDKSDITQITILGRVLTWTEAGLEYEADPKHRLDVMKMECLEENSKSVVSPATKALKKDDGEDELSIINVVATI